jgi:hypothetical protein
VKSEQNFCTLIIIVSGGWMILDGTCKLVKFDHPNVFLGTVEMIIGSIFTLIGLCVYIKSKL